MPTHTIAPARLRLGALAGCAALTLGALTAAPVSAHDTLIASTPEAEEVLAELPDQVVLEFSGSGLTTGDGITNDILVLDSEEQNWASEDPAEVDGSRMSTDLPEPLPNGEYEVHYRVVYSDGHSEESSFGFEVDVPAAEEDDDAQLAETEETESTAEPTDAEPLDTPAADDQATDAELVETDGDNAEESAPWGGILSWGALALAVIGLAVAAGYALRRRSRAPGTD
ncbi:copper resistance CopC family protein [Nesterenkonia muleiensis]|uniref:copper resistance CopC family protein n=1 Tax=Nesterenkonia muleiensis TaxID=2282648 RepID=UPI0013005800|nr:copper resistance CopC family protein [Nesterenkonia muleiensis]